VVAGAVTLLVGALLALGAAPAQAEDGATWQVRPAAADGASRAAFELGMDPGASANDTVVVTNLGAEPLSLKVGAADIVTTPSGDVTIAAPDAEPLAAAWVRLAVDHVDVAPQTSVEIPFSISPPANAEPGDYAVALMTSLTQQVDGEDGRAAMLETRVGARLYLRVLGELRADLRVEDLTVDRVAGWWNPLPAPVRTDLTVRNAGTVRMDATARVELTGPFGWHLGSSEPRELPQLLPGDGLRVSQAELAGEEGAGPLEVAGVLAPFLLRAEVTVDAVEVSTGQTFTYRASASQPELPWAVLVVLVGGVVWVVVTVARRRRRRAAAHRPTPDPTPGPLPAPVADPVPDPVSAPVPDPVSGPAPDPAPDAASEGAEEPATSRDGTG
jgi:hypothetical protein